MAEEVRRVKKRGPDVLRDPTLNKGTAFTLEERRDLGLEGLLPPAVNTLDSQMQRVVNNLRSKPDPLEQYIYLRSLQDRNETLFHATLIEHLEELAPIVYTPTVGEAVRRFSHIFRSSRGLFITPENIDQIDRIFGCAVDEDDEIGIIVCTDNEGILGIGDQGVGGIGIPIGKLALYAAAGGFPPSACLPISLDVGTDNEELLADPVYVGSRRRRLRGEEYKAFIRAFVGGVKRNCPGAVLQWEDFSKERAWDNLERYRDELPSFNDDIQGTAAVVHAGLLGALKRAERPLIGERIAVLGAGASGVGVASAILAALQAEGLSFQEASAQVLVFDRHGLVLTTRPGLQNYKRRIAHEPGVVRDWGMDPMGDLSLESVSRAVRPGIVIGLSGQPGALPETVVRMMADEHERPIVFVLSNPSANVDAHPHDVVRWSDGRAIVSVGSPFEPLEYQGFTHRFSQVNNFYAFPGLGAGAWLSRAKTISDGMLLACARAIHQALTADDLAQGLVLPASARLRVVAADVAAAVMQAAADEGVAGIDPPADPCAHVREWQYTARYQRYEPG
ncbi:MAG: NAD-dependent malic enzyme [candidate division WS1 bacterium]|jgi:malic enzyme|nr:NAD-dependent malic enzyme [candidate division WS1 bacterium]